MGDDGAGFDFGLGGFGDEEAGGSFLDGLEFLDEDSVEEGGEASEGGLESFEGESEHFFIGGQKFVLGYNIGKEGVFTRLFLEIPKGAYQKMFKIKSTVTFDLSEFFYSSFEICKAFN